MQYPPTEGRVGLCLGDGWDHFIRGKKTICSPSTPSHLNINHFYFIALKAPHLL